MGVIFESNQSVGTTPVSSDNWNMVLTAKPISSAVVLRYLAEISCGPVALFGFSPASSLINGWQLAKMKKSIPDMSLP